MGPIAVRTGQIVYLNDSSLNVESTRNSEPLDREPAVRLHFEMEGVESIPLFSLGDTQELAITAFTSLFGSDPYTNVYLGQQKGIPTLRVDGNNSMGCLPHTTESFLGSIVVVDRGNCTFLEKLVMATAAGAVGVIVISDEEHPINPTADQNELAAVYDQISDATIVVISPPDGVALRDLLLRAAQENAQVIMSLENSDVPASKIDSSEKQHTGPRYLYVNNRPIINVRLLV